jgi:glyoxylate/hydroxypyruvate reductase
MKLACLIVQDSEQETWFSALQAPLAAHHISLSKGPRPEAQIAIVANPPVGALRQLPNIELIASLWAGVDRLLADSSIAKHIPIVRACDAQMRQSMTESALAHVLRLHLNHHRYQAQQNSSLWRALDTALAPERRVTVLGLGYLGGYVASALAQLGFQVSGWSRGKARTRTLDPSIQVYSGTLGLSQALQSADILVNLLPDTPSTQGILSKETLSLAPPGLCVINLARGKHLVETELLELLEIGQVQHATLDVFDTEPLAPDHPFWRHQNITVTPHIAAPSHRTSVSKSVSDDIALWLAGQVPESIVNRELGY